MANFSDDWILVARSQQNETPSAVHSIRAKGKINTKENGMSRETTAPVHALTHSLYLSAHCISSPVYMNLIRFGHSCFYCVHYTN